MLTKEASSQDRRIKLLTLVRFSVRELLEFGAGLFLVLVLQSQSICAAPAAKSGEAGKGKTLAELFRETKAAAQGSRHAETIAKATAALALYPDSRKAADLYGWRAEAYLALNNNQRALADLNAEICCDPQRKSAYRNRAAVNYNCHNYAAVIPDATRRLHDGSSDALFVHAIRGTCYAKLGQVALARQDFAAVTKATARTTQDYVMRGEAFLKLGNYQAGLADFNKTLKLDSHNASALNCLAWVEATAPEASLRDGHTAVQRATQACEALHWRDSETLDTLAAAYAETSDFELALRYEKRAVALDKDAVQRQELEQHLSLINHHEPVRDDPTLK